MSVGELFAWGASTEGRVHSVDTHRSLRIRTLEGGYSRAAALHDGQGTGLLGGCGLEGVEGIEAVAVGPEHVLALLSDGRVVSCGEGPRGELGLGGKILSTAGARPITALQGKQVRAVACGAQHSAAVTESGDVYTWGAGFSGQTGHSSDALGEEENASVTGVQLLPKVVGSFVGRHRVVAVACGDRHTAAVTSKGQVWCWGEGKCGQLGIGKVSKLGRPALALEACPTTGSQLVRVTCGWGHTIALSSEGTLTAWGFNAYGQLGLGHKNSVFYPEAVDFPVPRGGGDQPVRVTQIAACGNFSGAVTETQEVYTWGCDSADGRLGHGTAGKGANRCVSRPVMVAALTGKQVTALALTTTDAFAFVPSVVYRVEPPCGPLSGGTKVHVHGGGFWDDESIVVRFASLKDLPTTPGKSARRKQEKVASDKPVPRAAVGQFLQDADASTGTPQVLWCRAPRAQVTGPAEVEVAMNGEDFTGNRIQYSYYKEPVLSSLAPLVFSAAAPCTFKIMGENLQETGLIRVKFKEKTPGTRECVVQGRCEYRPHGGGMANPEEDEGEEEEDRVSLITCPSPHFDGGFPLEARVAVALNGADFVFFQGTTVVAHDASTKAASPTCVPAEDKASFHVTGTSFFPSSTLQVRISVLAEGSLLGGATEAAGQIGPAALHVTVTEAQFISTEAIQVSLPPDLFSSTPNNLADLVLDEEASAAVQGKRIEDLFPPTSLSIPIRAEVSIDGVEFLAHPVHLKAFRPAVFEAADGHVFLGPFFGGTPVHLACEGTLFDSDTVRVDFDASEVPGGSCVSVVAQLRVDATSGRSTLSFESPAIPGIAAEAQAQVHTIPMRVALNGRDVLPTDVAFQAYTDPVVDSCNLEECRSGDEIVLSGQGLMASTMGQVKLLFKSTEVVVDGAVFSEEAITFSMPDLSTAVAPAADHEDEENQGENPLAEQAQDQEDVEAAPFAVAIQCSFNNGINFSAATTSLTFNPSPPLNEEE